MSHEVTEWFAQRVDATDGTVTMFGSGFGVVPGTVVVRLKPGGKQTLTGASILQWCDDVIVVAVPADVEVLSAEAVIVADDGSGKIKKHKARTPKKPKPKERTTELVIPSFSIAGVFPDVDGLTLTGSNLDEIEMIVLYDTDAPPLVVNADFIYDGVNLIVEWPANFSGDLEKLVAIKSPDQVQEVLAPPGGWSQSTPGLIQLAAGSRDAGGDILVTITGIGFGAVQGDVSLTDAGGTTAVLVNSWSDSAVVVQASPKTVYTGITLVDGNGVTADIDPSAPLPFRTPGLQATIFTVVQSGENPEEFTITGTNLDQVSDGLLQIDNGKSLAFYSDDPAFHDTAAAANNSAAGISSVSFAGGQIVVEAANDVGGEFARSLVLNDLNGSVNVADDFPDFLITGLPGNPSAIMSSATVLWDAVGAVPIVRAFGSGLSPAPMKLNLLDEGSSPFQIVEAAATQALDFQANMDTAGHAPGERYTIVDAVDGTDAVIDTSMLDAGLYFQMPGAPVTANKSGSSSVLRTVRVQGDGIADMHRVSIVIENPFGSNTAYTPVIGNTAWSTWATSINPNTAVPFASEAEFETFINDQAKVDSVTIVDPNTIDVLFKDNLLDPSAPVSLDPSGLGVERITVLPDSEPVSYEIEAITPPGTYNFTIV